MISPNIAVGTRIQLANKQYVQIVPRISADLNNSLSYVIVDNRGRHLSSRIHTEHCESPMWRDYRIIKTKPKAITQLKDLSEDLFKEV